jgi:type VI protein secretion system component VasK
VSDLLPAAEEELEAHAKNIRERVDELTNRLELVFPVYLLFTKCDLLSGFVEFFEDFTKQDRAQVWGCSLPYAPSAGKDYRQIFEQETQRLFRSLAQQRLGSLAGERPSAKKQSIFIFPLQFQAATKKLADFVGLLFRPNPFQETSVFRGFYFTSGTQEGTPIDQVIRSMSAAFGLKEDAAASAASPTVDKKSYFINHLFTKIIFADQNLARLSSRMQRRLKLVHYGTLGLSAVGTVFLLAALVVSFFGNRSLLSEARAAAVAVREAERSGAPPPQRLAALEGLRREAERLDGHDRRSTPLSLRWGLYRGGAVNPSVRQVYFEALRKQFLEPCAGRLRDDLEALFRKEAKTGEDYEQLDDLHRAYQMLGGILPAEKQRDLLEATLAKEGRWLARGQAAPPETAAQFRFFLSQLDRPEEWKVSVDRVIVNRVNEDLGQALRILQSYRDIVSSGQANFTKVAAETFVKGRGKDLLKFTYEFSSLFTQAGWNDYVKSAIRTKSEALAARYAELKIQRTAAQVEADLREKHAERFAREWDEYLKGVQVLPFQNLSDAAEKMKVLAGDPSPFNDLFKGVWESQRLRMDETALPGAVDLKPVGEAKNALYEFQQTVEEFVASTQPGTRVTGSVREGKLQPLLDAFKKAIRGLDAGVRIAPPAAQERLRGALYQLVDNTRAALAREAQDEADGLWGRTVVKAVKEGVAGHYPFEEASEKAAPMGGIAQLFQPKGTLFSTYENLRALNALNLEGKPLVAFSREFTSAIRRSEGLRDALFKGGAEKVNVPLRVTLKQRTGVAQVRFTLGSKEFKHNDFPGGRSDFVWQGEPGAKVSIRVGEEERWYETKDYSKHEWALLRLMADGNPQPQGDNAIVCTYPYKVTVQGVEQTLYADVVYETVDRVHPFGKEFFAKLVVPERVGP